MSNARNLARLIVDSGGDVDVSSLGNVPPSNDASALTTGTLPVGRVPYLTNRNRIINGDMRIDQRNAGASVTLGTSSSAYGADRFMVEQGGVTANTGTVQQVSDAPTGFKKSIKYTGGSATYNSQGFAAINQRIEGLNLADSDYGTASAKQFTLSFWVKASVTGTYSINFTHYDGSNERWLLQTYTVDSANTWEKKTITINGDTAYSIPADNGATGWMRVYWALGGDSNSMQGTVTGNWVAGSGSNRAVSGQVNVATTSGATFYITGVQLEAGSVATPFEHRDFGSELLRCKRYYEKSFSYDVAPQNGTSDFHTYYGVWYVRGSENNQYRSSYRWDVEKRASPSIQPYGNSSGYWYSPNTGWHVYNSVVHASTVGFLPRQQAAGANIEVRGHMAVIAEL